MDRNRWALLVDDLDWVADRLLRQAYKQAGDLDEREHPTLAGVVKDLVSEKHWRARPNLSLIEIVSTAIAKLPEKMSGRAPLASNREVSNLLDVAKGSNQWKDKPERHLAEILFGFRDDELTARFGKDREPFTYKLDYYPAARELAGFLPYQKSTTKRMIRVIREDIAYILLSLTPDDLPPHLKPPTESGQPTQTTQAHELAPTTYGRDHQQTDSGITACAGVANVTAGSTVYYGAVAASYDEVVKLLLTYYNNGPDHSDVGITPRLESPQRIEADRWKIGWEVRAGENVVNPSVVVNLKRTDAVLVYTAGTAVWRHNVALPGEAEQAETQIIPDADILTPTHPLETLHWGDDYAATITALFRVQIPGIRIVVYGQSPVNGNWLQELYTQPNIQFPLAIVVQNIGNINIYGVVVGASLPPHSTYIPGSTVLATGFEDEGRPLPDGLTDRIYAAAGEPPIKRGGVSIGTLTPGQEVVVRFGMQLDAEPGSDMRAVGYVSATGHNEFYNTIIIYTEPESQG